LIEILIIILFLFWIFCRNTKYKIQNTKYKMPVALIFFGLLSSVLTNKNYYIGLGVVKGWFVLPIIFALILYDNLKKNEKILSWSLWAIFSGGALVAIEGMRYWLFSLVTYDGRLRIFFDSPNQLAMYLAPVFLIGVLMSNLEELSRFYRDKEKIEPWKRSAVIFSLVLILFNLYLTKSYGAWLSLGLTVTAILWLKYRKKWQKKYIVASIILIIFIVAAGFFKVESIKKLGDRSSLASRFMIWKSAGLMIQKNPIFGIGPGNFQNKYLEYQKYFPPYLEWAVPQPHNLYLAFWLESGLIGLIGFFWLVWLFFRDNKKARQGRDSPEAVRENNLATGFLCLAIILYFLIHGLIDTTYWRNDMAIVFWAVIAANVYLAEISRQYGSQ